jgi:tetratricopeptide (TPR) repeat protein
MVTTVDYTFRMLRPAARGVAVLSLALALVALVPAAAVAQGHLAGTIRDASGHPVKGATITAENQNFPAATSASDAKGRYSFVGLRGGTWALTVQAPGFLTQKRQVTTRAIGTNAAIDFDLQPLTETTPAGPMATIDAKTLQQQLAKAADLDSAGKIDEAIAAYRDILEHAPALTTVHLQLGALFERRRDTASAVSEYQALLKADPANPKARAALDRLARQ